MYIFFAIVLLVPMLALRRRAEGDTSILDPKSTTCIKGLLCIYVMIHNLGMDLPNDKLKMTICEHVGGVGVGLFFFLSAFGIVRAYQAQGNRSLRRLLLVHVPKMWGVAVFINALTYFVFMRGEFEPLDMWLRILNLDLFNGMNRINLHGWYIASIIAIYFLFAAIYFVCSKLKTEKRFIIAACILAALIFGLRLAAVQADYGRLYTRELPTFAFGCLYATFYDKINAFAKKHFIPGMIITVCALVYGFLMSEPLATYAAACIIVLVSQKFTYYSSAAYFLGKICLGVYLFLHFSSLVLKPYLAHEYLWVLLNAGFVLEAATVIHAVQFGIDCLVCRVRALFPKRTAKLAEKEEEKLAELARK